MLKEYCLAHAEWFLNSIDGLVMQPDRNDTEMKTSCYHDQCPNPEEAARVIDRRVGIATNPSGRAAAIWTFCLPQREKEERSGSWPNTRAWTHNGWW